MRTDVGMGGMAGAESPEQKQKIKGRLKEQSLNTNTHLAVLESLLAVEPGGKWCSHGK